MNKYTLIYICIEQSCVAFYILKAIYFYSFTDLRNVWNYDKKNTKDY